MREIDLRWLCGDKARVSKNVQSGPRGQAFVPGHSGWKMISITVRTRESQLSQAWGGRLVAATNHRRVIDIVRRCIYIQKQTARDQSKKK
jgi:hypothetical protein